MIFSSAWAAHKARHKMSVFFMGACWYCRDIQTQGHSASRWVTKLDESKRKYSHGKRRRSPVGN